jgi:hypothetical protein
MTRRIADAVDRADLDELVRLVHVLCGEGDWEGVAELRSRCRHALERGLQLWPAAEYADYRLALEAPADYAGAVVVEGAGRFALGPLWEVAASTHSWQQLAPHLAGGPARTMAAHERVIRGEDLEGDTSVDRSVLELPLRLQPWEPRYQVATFHSDKADFPAPARPRLRRLRLPEGGTPLDGQASVEALVDLGRVWAEQSNGAVDAVAVAGSAESAIAALGYRRVLAAEIDVAAAFSWMVWAGASGGAYGRRRGTPAGRFAAWWAASTLAGLDWPPPPAQLGEAAAGLRWLLWEPSDFAAGWGLYLAVECEEAAFAVAATDSHREEDAQEV